MERVQNGRNISMFVGLWLFFSAILEYFAHLWVIHTPYYYVASLQGGVSLDAFDTLVYVSVILFVFIILFMAFAAVRFRQRAGETGDSPVQNQSNLLFQRSWMVLTIAIVMTFFLHPDLSGMEQLWAYGLPPWNHGALVVNVQARQCQFRFGYPQYGLPMNTKTNGRDVLVVPAGREIKFVMNSLDVTHSFYVPAWGIKADIIPGITRDLYITPTQITSTAANPMVRLQCAQLCGAGHSYMEADVEVVSPQAFAIWVAQEKTQVSNQNS
ncbi:cytochrome c oxidase subunit II [Ferroacidibacillus organovorans]|uniref:cytochrome-c oxidase n=1 Tax=Ferroacidibacillus organovorans TaxID=1765683 RepID=A0A853K9E6_9BACL|nr:cytochrome c oxidase subunit II [Ferroacidibacillus organovorans]KYP80940.1 hypothetical protein AYJ22_09460 [Ferroacidibacillus organovorans]OAG93645.1 hypothetical protein AYW79_09405 [Ferroacidibacillus organovorans]